MTIPISVRIVTLAFIQAYAKMVNELGLVTPGDAGTAQAAPAKTYTAQALVAMRATAAAGGKVIRTLPAGTKIYPTGNKNGLWWKSPTRTTMSALGAGIPSLPPPASSCGQSVTFKCESKVA